MHPSRALKSLETNGILYPEEVADTRKVLRAAALTYVASAASADFTAFTSDD